MEEGEERRGEKGVLRKERREGRREKEGEESAGGTVGDRSTSLAAVERGDRKNETNMEGERDWGGGV